MNCIKNKDELIEKLLTTVREGGTFQSACKELEVAERIVRYWRKNDELLNERFLKARLESPLAKLDMYEDALKAAKISKDRNEILAADKLLAHARWEAEKLLTLFQPVQKSEVAHTGPMIIGWDDGDGKISDIKINVPVSPADTFGIEDRKDH